MKENKYKRNTPMKVPPHQIATQEEIEQNLAEEKVVLNDMIEYVINQNDSNKE